MRMTRNVALKAYHFSRRFAGNDIVPFILAGVTQTFSQPRGVAFFMSQVLNISEFANLFDQYFVKLWIATFTLVNDASAQSSVGEARVPVLYWAKDYDDNNDPANSNELRERQDCQIRYMQPGRPIHIKIRPRIAATVFSTGVTNATGMRRSWIDMQRTDVPHYGYKYIVENMNANHRVRVEQRVYFKCRGVS
jgi:hypothetical protein